MIMSVHSVLHVQSKIGKSKKVIQLLANVQPCSEQDQYTTHECLARLHFEFPERLDSFLVQVIMLLQDQFTCSKTVLTCRDDKNKLLLDIRMRTLKFSNTGASA